MDEKKDEKRDEKGRFKKGYSGGPGRGHRKPFKPLDQDELEGVIAEGLRSKDGKERAVWARVMLAYEKQKGKDDQDRERIDPIVLPLISLLWDYSESHLAKTGEPINGFKAVTLIRDHLEGCPTSPLGSYKLIEEIEDDETE